MPGYKKRSKSKVVRGRKKTRGSRSSRSANANTTKEAADGSTVTGVGNNSADTGAPSDVSCSDSMLTESTLPASSNDTTLNSGSPISDDNDWEDTCFTFPPASKATNLDFGDPFDLMQNEDVCELATNEVTTPVTPTCSPLPTLEATSSAAINYVHGNIQHANVKDVLEECNPQPFVNVTQVQNTDDKIEEKSKELKDEVFEIINDQKGPKKSSAQKDLKNTKLINEAIIGSLDVVANAAESKCPKKKTSIKIETVEEIEPALDIEAQILATKKDNVSPTPDDQKRTKSPLPNLEKSFLAFNSLCKDTVECLERAASCVETTTQQKSLCLNLMRDDFIGYNTAAIKDAEAEYFSRLHKVGY